MEKMLEQQLTIKEVFHDIDYRHHSRSIQSLWDELHATQRQIYYDRMARFRFDDSVDVMAKYGDHQREK